ncbi:hypothetical protein [Flavobacterium sp.]|uniref:hypothetical protein n=1 Tax=Flavobacterium sp. TaxID=239 RepID=UPI003F69814F
MKNKYYLIVFTLLTTFQYVFSQENPLKFTESNKGKFFVYWGGNRESYSDSDIRFKGADYDFTIYNVEAHDKPKGWHVDYINPSKMTIPQTNFRMGYFITDKYNISLGVDHMKYVMSQNRRVKYSGYYPNQGTYDENPTADELTLDENFLTFEHTDGLNYINTEISRFEDISKLFKIQNTDKFQVNLQGGIGGGILYPKTNAKLLGKERHDDFHVSGYGVSAKAGINLTFFKHFFIMYDIKGGYINMNDIRTTAESTDTAQQDFFFFQKTIALGGIFRL